MRVEDRWLAFVPRDTIFVRDGRAFDAGDDVAAHGVTPGPSTLAGATGAAFGAEIDEVRGPVLANLDGERWHPWFPAPLDVVADDVASAPFAYRLRPESVPEPTDLEAGLHLLLPPAEAGTTVPVTGLIDGRALADYLAGNWPVPGGGALADIERVETPLLPETRIGLARDGRRVRSGYLYRVVHLRPVQGWGLLAGCVLPDAAAIPQGPVQLGGRGRLADVRDAGPVTWPQRPAAFPGGRLLVYVATPAIWPDGWRLPLPDGAELVAAATGDPVPAATLRPGRSWRQDRTLRWAVPAGSVYLLRFGDAAAAESFAARTHGSAYQQAEERLRTAGYGVILTGVWS